MQTLQVLLAEAHFPPKNIDSANGYSKQKGADIWLQKKPTQVCSSLKVVTVDPL